MLHFKIDAAKCTRCGQCVGDCPSRIIEQSGLAKMVMELLPEIKAMVGVPEGHYYYAMLFGVPAVHYARTVQREAASQVRRVQV